MRNAFRLTLSLALLLAAVACGRGLESGDLRAFVQDMNTALNGRGGGKPNFAQGRVAAKRAEIEAFWRRP